MPVEGLWVGNATSRDRGRRERTRQGDDCFHQGEAIKTSRSTPRSRASMLLIASASADPLEAGGRRGWRSRRAGRLHSAQNGPYP